jgi:hypothetical protein
MTSISFTSGEILDIISALQDRVVKADYEEDSFLAVYYLNLIQQFETIDDKLQEFVPENRVAHLVLACN